MKKDVRKLNNKIERGKERKKKKYCLDRGTERKRMNQRKRLYREKQKVLKVKLGQSAFKNRQTKGKATKKLHKALPNTPTKRVEVIRSLFKSLSPKTKVSVTEHNTVPYNTLSQETVELVASFYQDDSISRNFPGIKDVISTKCDDGTKEKKR